MTKIEREWGGEACEAVRSKYIVSVFRSREISIGKKNAAKMQCGENSRDEVSSDEIGRGENIMHETLTRRKFLAAKYPVAKISRAEIFCTEISGSEI